MEGFLLCVGVLLGLEGGLLVVGVPLGVWRAVVGMLGSDPAGCGRDLLSVGSY